MKHIFLLLLLFAFSISYAQYNHIIRTGRPGQTIGSFTVGKGVLQFHQGLDYIGATKEAELISSQGMAVENDVRSETYLTQNIIRFGVLEKLEISAAINYQWENKYYHFEANLDPALEDFTRKNNDFQNIDIGLRYNILDGNNKNRLAWGIQARTGLYQWVFNNGVNNPDFKVITAFGKAIGDKSRIRINMGANVLTRSGNIFLYGINYNFNPVSKFGFSLEYTGRSAFSSIRSGLQEHAALIAIHYLLNNDVLIDIRTGLKKHEEGEQFPISSYIGAGISWRVRTTKR